MFKRTLKSTFLLFFIPLILVFVTVTGMVSYFLASSQLRANAETSIQDTLTQTKDYLNEKLSVVLAELTAIDNSSELRALMQRADKADFQMTPEDYLVLSRHLDTAYANLYSIVDSVYFYYKDGQLAFYRKDYLQTENVRPPVEFESLPYTSSSWVYWLNLHPSQRDSAGEQVISLYKWEEGKVGAREGILVIQLKERLLRSLLSAPEISPNGYLLAASQDGLVRFKTVKGLYAMDEILLQKKLLAAPAGKGRFETESLTGRKLTVIYDTIGMNKWKLAAVYPQQDLYTRFRSVRVAILSVMGAVIVLAVMLSGWIAGKITKPLSQLTRAVNAIDQGHLEVKLFDHPNQEISILNKSIRDMLRRIQELLGQVEQEQEQKRLTELSVLQAQIQPHFLYNTLYSIKSLCEMNETEDASRMLTALSHYYRISISKGSPIISVASEREHIIQYLYIQQMRYGDTFRYELELEEGMLTCPVVKLTLQPLVENAIYHGVKKIRHPGLIEVRGWLSGGDGYFEVRDNGYGMEPERLRALREGLERDAAGDVHAEESSQVGYGVRNVHRRLRLHYGPGYGLTYESKLGQGTTVTVRFAVQPPLAEVSSKEY
ncbi:sensor histidine kinase [Paenibacillus sp. HW567]|uniref:sensor histidine kinase n=1 Tax=Paenibacillus sp. HW567 TaxID=1034769 RepID=UPI00035C6469|nr:sensor histidine kinase [Paenibacillus sp. HW567]